MNRFAILGYHVDDDTRDAHGGRMWRRDKKHGYLRASIGGKVAYLHRLVSGAGPRDTVRFKDGDRRNCMRSNLLVFSGSVSLDELTLDDAWRERLAGATLRRAGDYVRHGSTYLHRAIANAPAGARVEFVDGNPDNLTAANLRVVPRATRYRGVHKHTRNGNFVAGLRYAGQYVHAGVHPTEEAAARAYDAKCRELGLQRRLNFPA